MAEALKVNETLTALSLSFNENGDFGAVALAEALKVNGTLMSLSLWSNQITEAGATALAGALEMNGTLVELDLSDNVIGSAGAAALSVALRVNSTLTRLDVWNNHHDDAVRLSSFLSSANSLLACASWLTIADPARAIRRKQKHNEHRAHI